MGFLRSMHITLHPEQAIYPEVAVSIFSKLAMETLSNCLCGMKRKAHGAQEPKHV